MTTQGALVSREARLRPMRQIGGATRLVSALVLTTSLATLPRVGGWAGPFIAVSLLLAGLVLRPNLSRLARRFAIVVPMIAIFAAPFLLAAQFEAAARLAFRALSAALTVLIFTAGMSPAELTRTLASLRVPASLVDVVDGLLLELDGLLGVARRIVLAQRLRGAKGLRIFTRLVPELLVQSAERAERVDLARRLRGYGVRRQPLSLTPADLACFILVLSFAGAVHYLALP